MATEIIMPKAGMDMVEGTVIKWLVQEGDKVETGDPILEILTDKVNMEVEAETSGTILKILAQEGEVLPVLTVIGYMGEAGESVPDASTPAAQEKAAPANQAEAQPEGEAPTQEAMETKPAVLEEGPVGKVRATPAARFVAKERGIQLQSVPGSGPKGRIQKADVEDFKTFRITPLAAKIAQGEGVALESIQGTGHLGKITRDDVVAGLAPQPATATAAPAKAPEAKETKGTKLIPMVGIRKIIAERMIESQHKAAAVSLTIEIDMNASIELRTKIKDQLQQETGLKITYTDLLIMAVSKALVKYPMVNATMTEAGILINDSVNMGIAVGLDSGLLVPVINGTDKMNLTQIVESRSDIVGRTTKGKIKPNELQGSTFTISNLGMFDTVSFTSIINQPNSAILSVGAILERMRVVNGTPQVRNVMNVTITLDHRVMDGVEGAKFLQHLKGLLEEPTRMLL